MNLTMLVEMVAEGDPGRVVIGSKSNGIRADQLLKRSRRAAHYFIKGGAQYVGYFGLNSDILPVALFAAAHAGLPFVPLNYRATDDQLSSALGRIAPSILAAAPDDEDRLRSRGATAVVALDELDRIGQEASAIEELPSVSGDDVAILLFTSGTTGDPKAAVLRHRHLVSYIFGSVDFLSCDPAEAQLVSVPSYHIAGMSAVLSALFAGRRIVYLPAFEPEAWVRTAHDEEITHAMVVPTMLARILTVLEASGTDLPALRHLSYGGGRMPHELIERAMQALPQVDFVNAYGLTETSSTIAMLSPDDHREAWASDDPAIRRRLSSVGRPLPALEIEIRDADGAAVPTNEKGEIWVRGEQVAGEYVGQDGSAEGAWFRTKDEGFFDDGGFLFVQGRLDDVIVRGAENISPGEIEDVLALHPAIADAAVIGIPDSEWGEAVAAAVVLHPDQSAEVPELQAWVRERLRSTKTPSVIVFRAELPYNATGKLLRRQLRDELRDSIVSPS
jgi:acyl-CoA synthetase (AMP-forming)/AMP-acid ligase II